MFWTAARSHNLRTATTEATCLVAHAASYGAALGSKQTPRYTITKPCCRTFTG